MSEKGYTPEQRSALNTILRLVEENYPHEEFVFGEIGSLQEDYTWDELKTILEYIDHAEHNKDKLFLVPMAYMNLRLATYKQIFDKIKHVCIQENCPICEKVGRKSLLVFISPQYLTIKYKDGTEGEHREGEALDYKTVDVVTKHPISIPLNKLFPEMESDGREGSYFAMCTECGHAMVTDR